jgi:hypothetical protein
VVLTLTEGGPKGVDDRAAAFGRLMEQGHGVIVDGRLLKPGETFEQANESAKVW